MTTAVESHDHADTAGHDHGHDGAHSWPDRKYVGVALLLAVLTGVEVLIPALEIGTIGTAGLIILMCVKFLIVALFFMHLRFDNRLFGLLFWAGLGLALFVYLVALSTFHVFSGG